jgi:hypothetical protein
MLTEVKTITKNCPCGRTFSVTPSEQKFYADNELQVPVRCPVCRAKRKAPAIIAKCKDCGKEFEITGSEASWLKARGYEMPKRCAECRAYKKNMQDEINAIATEAFLKPEPKAAEPVDIEEEGNPFDDDEFSDPVPAKKAPTKKVKAKV